MMRSSCRPALMVIADEAAVDATSTHGMRVKRAPRASVRTTGVARATKR